MEIVLNSGSENKILENVSKIKVLRVLPNIEESSCVIIVALLDADGKKIGIERIRESSKAAVDAMINASTSCETMLAAVYTYLQSTFDGTIAP